MPELPEVTTTVNGLQKVLPRLTITDVWTDLAKKNQTIKQFKETIKNEVFFKKFKKEVIGKKIINVERRAKNILINIFGTQTILIHLKMTGHLLFGKYHQVKKGKLNTWVPDEKEKAELHDPYNRFIHVVFSLSNGKHLAFCDSRKFGKVTLIPTDTAHQTIHLKNIGPEPLEENFTFEKFKNQLDAKQNGNIKTVLMDQSVVAGIGNIYSDEILWIAGIHPESKTKNIPKPKLQEVYKAMQKILNEGISFGGDSMSDYRNINGAKGEFQNHHNVYQKKGEVRGKKGCRGVILRKVINGRSAHFCDTHQKLFD